MERLGSSVVDELFEVSLLKPVVAKDEAVEVLLHN
jgi:hypothetical protein